VTLLSALLAGFGTTPTVSDATGRLPRVISLNLCTDLQLMLLADPEQILSLTWLARDPRSSPLADAAAHFASNRGLAEDVLPLAPDVVLAGTYTARFTTDLVRRLGIRVVEVQPVDSVDGVEASMLEVGEAIGQRDRALRLNAEYRSALRRTAGAWRTNDPGGQLHNRAVLLGAGGFTGGADTLAGSVLAHLGLVDAAQRFGAEGWGRVGIEELLRLRPDILIITVGADAAREPSMSIDVLRHPALRSAALGMRRIVAPTTDWSCGTPLVARAAARLAARAPRAARRTVGGTAGPMADPR